MIDLNHRSAYEFDLPPELIAQRPPERRGESRLLVLDPSQRTIADSHVVQLGHWLHEGDLLVFNDTRVVPARLFGRKQSGGRIEVFLERVLDEDPCRALVQIRASKAPRNGSWLEIAQHAVEVIGRRGALFELRFPGDAVELFEQHGRMPLPPYIERDDDDSDRERYQTVFARNPGAVAAPTAGLHFTPELLRTLAQRGIDNTCITLHVGLGTFTPMRSERVEQHRMHSERYVIDATTCALLQQTKQRGGRIVAVGTTVVRTLESACLHGELQPSSGETDIFIHPGFRFRCIDALLTNFHLPGSTLMMLVAAFGGYTSIMSTYQHAIEQRYRFFSYGDAMLITQKAPI